MTSGGAARLGSDTKIAWIEELDVLGGFLQPFCVNIFGNGAAIFENGIVRLDVSFFFCGFVIGGIWIGVHGGYGRVSAVTVCAAEMHGFCGMHGWFVSRAVAGDAACGFGGGFGIGLAAEGRAEIGGLVH